jgi:hypothetical protein
MLRKRRRLRKEVAAVQWNSAGETPLAQRALRNRYAIEEPEENRSSDGNTVALHF